MAKEEWGAKRVCPETGKRFYDLNKNPIVSPYTGEIYELSFFTNDKSKTKMSDSADKATVDAATKDDLETEVDVLDDEEETTAVNLGDDLLDDDEDDAVPLEEIADVAAPDDDS